MIAAAVLLTYAALAASVGARTLRRWVWLQRHPRWGILAWQTLGLTVLLAGLLSAVSLALPFLSLRFPLADVIGVPPIALVEHYATPLDPWPGLIALTAVGVLLALTTVRLVRDARGLTSERRAQRDQLMLVGRRHPDGFIVVDHDTPVAYCLPRSARGGAPAVVVSSGAVDLLTVEERYLVLAHEARHLAGRHHLALTVAGTLARTFERIKVFPTALEQITVLAEMDADDAARTPRERRALASALVTLGCGARPQAALGAGDTAALQRVRRLVATEVAPRLNLGQGALVGLVASTILAIPLSIAMAPAIETAVRQCCSLSVRPAS
ncbi:M56 family metallopeptidase [Nocardioides sp. ChNu-153]|uniref:M56 family metallopeptidase n=1 Tax=unclassified Nocardioides TaxID=2615069 RepID=UPI0024074BDA|nr:MULTISPECIES: M56 family metallopeptidase [unclassified Nocardioides]MDF9714860.1 M56 family metallopeptidase [Nocardioides sp. ChNu-99]MDN7120014.1 M56 family metallopeptidase [Nocardioides sp. ChNu-153]